MMWKIYECKGFISEHLVQQNLLLSIIHLQEAAATINDSQTRGRRIILYNVKYNTSLDCEYILQTLL